MPDPSYSIIIGIRQIAEYVCHVTIVVLFSEEYYLLWRDAMQSDTDLSKLLRILLLRLLRFSFKAKENFVKCILVICTRHMRLLE